MKEKLTLLFTLSITMVYTIGYILSPIFVATSFTEQKLNTNTISNEIVIEETHQEQETLQTIQKMEPSSNFMPSPPSSDKIETETQIETVLPSQVEYDSRKIWSLLLDFGFTRTTAAGIMGNFVAEVGDPSTKEYNFDLDWKSNTGIEIGLCQWTQGRRNAIIDRYGASPSYEEQLEFMYSELTGINDVERQVTERQYQLIINASTPEEAAYYFALYFERCYKDPTGNGRDSYSARQFKAKQAYDYFS